ncbi:hypothetical protein HanRHA438_Chr07g0294601 [Helianthus annuus]|nr:hypothetical protein HanRHA438_Chr07g0294601 [Helianthus annuus]
MATAQLPGPTFVYSRSPSSTKTSVNFRTCSLRLSSSKSGSLAVKCSSNGGNGTTNTNKSSGLKDLLSCLVHESPNKDGRRDLLDLLRKAAQRVVQPEAETKKTKLKSRR